MPSEKMSLSIEHAEEFLTQRDGNPVSDLIALNGGEWSQAFAYRQGSKDYVARFNPSSEDFLCDAHADRFNSKDLPIPKIIELGTAFDGHYAISERAFGTMIDDLDEFAIKRLIPSLFKTLDATRKANVADSTGFGIWDGEGNGIDASWEDMLLSVSDDNSDSRIYGWKKALIASPTGNMPFQNAYEKLEDLAKEISIDRSLIYGDYMHYNVLTNNDQITAIFDWGYAKYGDFLYDLAMFTFWGPIREQTKSVDWETEARQHYAKVGLTVPDFDKRLQTCMLHIGLDAMSFYAFRQNVELLQHVTDRTMEVTHIEPQQN